CRTIPTYSPKTPVIDLQRLKISVIRQILLLRNQIMLGCGVLKIKTKNKKMKKDKLEISRRKFLVAAATATLTPPLLFSHPVSASTKRKKLAHACIGVGGMGWYDLQRFQAHPDLEIVAICDVDQNNLKRAA